jgi:hypothetical protein
MHIFRHIYVMLDLQHKGTLHLKLVRRYCPFPGILKRRRLFRRRTAGCTGLGVVGGNVKESHGWPTAIKSPHSRKSRAAHKPIMVGLSGKTPRHKLMEEELRLCRLAALSDRHQHRLRRAEEKPEDGSVKKKKASRKKAAKRTTPAMEVAESKGSSPHDSVQRSVPAGAKDAHAAQESAEAKATAADSQSTQRLPLATDTRAPPAPDSPEMAAAAEVVEDIVNSVAIAGTTTPTRPPARSGGSRPSGRAKEKQPAG